MDHQYRENGARNLYSNYNQMRAYVECSSNQSRKLYRSYRVFHQAIDKTLKVLEKCWPFLYLNFTRVLQFSSTSPRLSVVSLRPVFTDQSMFDQSIKLI